MWILYMVYFLNNGNISEITPLRKYTSASECNMARLEVYADPQIQMLMVRDNYTLLCVNRD